MIVSYFYSNNRSENVTENYCKIIKIFIWFHLLLNHFLVLFSMI